MISKGVCWFEKHNKISLVITIFIAVFIFYMSSLSFEYGSPGPQFTFKSTLYHIFIFFLLAFFILISLIKGNLKNKKLFLIALLITILYGISDEIHQLFIPGRSGNLEDILTNSMGVLFAGFLYFFKIKKSN